MRFTVVTLATFILCCGCSNQPAKPDNLLPEKSYIHLMVELQLVSTYEDQRQADSTTVDSLRHLIFEKYGATSAQFRSSHEYYQQHIEKQEDRIKKAIDDLREDHMAEQDSTAANDTTKSK